MPRWSLAAVDQRRLAEADQMAETRVIFWGTLNECYGVIRFLAAKYNPRRRNSTGILSQYPP